MNFLKSRTKEVVLGVLILSNLFVWSVVLERREGDVLSVYFLDVGQGDAIFIDSPKHGRMLIDGGPTRVVLSELGRIMPFSDKRIDVVVATHPDRDHIGGLPEVVKRYDVGVFLEPGVESDNDIDDTLRERLSAKGVSRVYAKSGMTINFGDGVKFVVFFPDRDVSGWETNDGSIVGKLVYGKHSFLLTGDAPLKVENILMSANKSILDVDVLKAGHHGSRTSTTLLFAETTSPEFAIISAGKDNSYGHPHAEVLNNLEKAGAEVLSTAKDGTIKFETDGEILKLR